MQREQFAIARWLAAFAVLALAYWVFVAAAPRSVGIWQDDGIYLCTAKALASGQGYRHIELPGQPWQTKYPPLYPAMLALGLLFNGEVLQRLWLLLAGSAVPAAGLVVLTGCYCRRALSAAPRTVAWVSVLAALSPALLSLMRFAMSDLLYGAIAVGALLCLEHAHAAAGHPGARRRHWASLAGAAVLIGLAMLTRSIGVTLAIAAAATLLLRWQFTAAFVLTAIVVLCVAPWHIWKASAAADNERAIGQLAPGAAAATKALEAPELSYEIWRPPGAAEVLRVAQQNSLRALFGLGYFQLALPERFIQAALGAATWRTAALFGVCLAAVGLIAAGFVRSLRGGWSTLHVYAPLYAAAVLVWPFEPYRFLAPWTPFLLYFLLAGWVTTNSVSGIAAQQRGPASARKARWRTGAATAWTLGGLIAVGFVYEDVQLVRSTPDAYRLREVPIDWTEVYALEEWLRAHAPTDAVVASPQPAGLFLATALRGQYYWPDSDPYALYYGADRDWHQFYVQPSASEDVFIRRGLERDFFNVYSAAGIDYLVLHPALGPAAGGVMELLQKHPTWFEPVYVTPGQTYAVFRVMLGGAKR